MVDLKLNCYNKVIRIVTIGNTIVSFDFATLENQDSPNINNNDKFSNAQKILKEHGYNLKDIYDDEETQANMPDIKTYNYEGQNGIISIRTGNGYIYEVNYYE